MTPATSPLVVRRPGPEDLARVVEIEQASFADPWSPVALQSELVRDYLRRPLVAEADGRVVGYLMAWSVVEILHVLNIASDPALRRRGIGRALLLAAAAEAREAGLVRVTLEVRRSNAAARAFYARFGFVEAGVREGYYADDGEDAIIMDAPLDDLPDSRKRLSPRPRSG
jgi:ribosomal-protein-alanine N-acetyltransferase